MSSCPPSAAYPRLPVRKRHVRALVGYLALAALFYLPQLLGIRSFPQGDFGQHFLPFSLWQRAELLAGRLPIWNPYTYGGHPFLADVQAAVYYPISNLVLWLTLPFSGLAARFYFLEVEAALHLLLAGFFTYLLAYELTRREVPAFLAGCAFAFSGYLTGYPPLQLSVLRTAIWLPLILWLLLRALSLPVSTRDREKNMGGTAIPPGPTTRWSPWLWTAGAALAYAVAFLAGHSQTFLFVSYAVGAWVVLLLIQAAFISGRDEQVPSRSSRLWPRLGRVALFYALFLALSAAQLWPSLEFTALSVRANVDYAFVSGGFPLEDTWQMLLPGVLTVYSPLYIGTVGLGLAVLGLVSALPGFPRLPGRARGFIAFFGLLVLLALLAGYGDNAFLYPIFYRWLPGWQLFRGQERAAYLVTFGLSMLAGYGAAALDRGLAAGRRGAWALGFACLVTLGILAFSAFWAMPGHIDQDMAMFWPTAAAGLVLTWAAAAVCLGPPNAPARWGARPITIWLLVLVIAGSFLANFGTNAAGDTPAQAVAPGPEIRAVQTAVQARSDANLGLPGRVHNEYRVYDDYGMAAGVEDVWGASPLKLARYAALFDQFPMDRMWRLLGVEHVLTWQKTLPQPSQLLAEFPQPTDVTYLHRLAALNPRAWIVHTAQWIDDSAALRSLADHQFNLDETALLGAGQQLADGAYEGLKVPKPTVGAPGQDRVQLVEAGPAHLQAQVESEHGGLLLVSENWMPGWQATVRAAGATETRSAPVLRADLTLLAIPVPSGTSTVDLVYRPASVYQGLLISLAGLLLILALFVGGVAARRAGQVSG